MHIIQVLRPFPFSELGWPWHKSTHLLTSSKQNKWHESNLFIHIKLHLCPYTFLAPSQQFSLMTRFQRSNLAAWHIVSQIKATTNICVSSTDIKKPQRPWTQLVRRPQWPSATWERPSAESWGIWGIVALAIFSHLFLHLLCSLALSFTVL